MAAFFTTSDPGYSSMTFPIWLGQVDSKFTSKDANIAKKLHHSCLLHHSWVCAISFARVVGTMPSYQNVKSLTKLSSTGVHWFLTKTYVCEIQDSWLSLMHLCEVCHGFILSTSPFLFFAACQQLEQTKPCYVQFLQKSHAMGNGLYVTKSETVLPDNFTHC